MGIGTPYGPASFALGLTGTAPDRISDIAVHDAESNTPRDFWHTVIALNGDVTFDNGTEVDGNAGIITNGDVLREGQSLSLPFTALQRTSGTTGILIAIPG